MGEKKDARIWCSKLILSLHISVAIVWRFVLEISSFTFLNLSPATHYAAA